MKKEGGGLVCREGKRHLGGSDVWDYRVVDWFDVGGASG